MVCPTCESEMGTIHGRYQFRECGLDFVWLDKWPLRVCPNGHAKLPVLPDADSLNVAIAKALVVIPGALNGDAILFLREILELRAHELATILDVNRVEVSRWENDHATISPYVDFKLRLEVVDRALPAKERRDLRDEIALLFQRQYASEIVSDPVLVPPPQTKVEEAIPC